MNYRQVERLFDMLAEYFHNKPPPEELDGDGEWVKVRDGLEGVEHCIRVLTPEEFDEWHRCIAVPVEVESGRRPVAFCSYEGRWWVIYGDTDEGEVIRRFEKCFEGPPPTDLSPGHGGLGEEATGPVICRFGDTTISLPPRVFPPSHFHAARGNQRAVFTIVGPRLLRGEMTPEAAAAIVAWAQMHERELLEAWEDHAAGREPRTIEAPQNNAEGA